MGIAVGSAEKLSEHPVSRGHKWLDRIEYRLAVTPADREEIFRLRYRAYLNEGAITPNDSGLTTDRYDDMPNTWVFGLYLDGELASSIRISVASADCRVTPSVDVFPDLLGPEIERGRVIVDPTRFVANSERAKGFTELPYLTVRLAYLACSHFKADLGIATVRPEHQAFYRRVFMHQPLSGPRHFPGLIKPVCLMAVDFGQMRDKVFARYPFMESSASEQAHLFGTRDRPFAPRRVGSSIAPAA